MLQTERYTKKNIVDPSEKAQENRILWGSISSIVPPLSSVLLLIIANNGVVRYGEIQPSEIQVKHPHIGSCY